MLGFVFYRFPSSKIRIEISKGMVMTQGQAKYVDNLKLRKFTGNTSVYNTNYSNMSLTANALDGWSPDNWATTSATVDQAAGQYRLVAIGSGATAKVQREFTALPNQEHRFQYNLSLLNGGSTTVRVEQKVNGVYQYLATQQTQTTSGTYELSFVPTETDIRISVSGTSRYALNNLYLDRDQIDTLVSTYALSRGYRYGFQGQEKDDEVKGKGNSVNYTYRMHDPRLGRFFAIDPMASQYPFYSPYAFSGNRVLDAVELEGLQPGVLFDTPRKAAMDWAFHYSDESIRNNKEYASCIYKVTSGEVVKYAYSKPNIGTAHKSEVPDSPNGEKIVADIHSHGAYEGYPDEHLFSGESKFNNREENKANLESGTDIGGYNYYGRIGYLANHRGQLRVYNPKTGQIESASTSLPVDPNDPVQYNDNVVKPYDNIINLGAITFNSDKATKSDKGNWLIVKDLKSGGDFGVIRNDNGSYRFKTDKDE